MAVYTDVPYEDLAAFIASYDIGNLLTFHGISEGVENSNYLLQTESGTYILTLYEKRVKAEDLPFFLCVMGHLAARGLSCPLPVQTRQGTVLQTLCGRPAALFTFLKGISLRRFEAAHCYSLGIAMARMHQAGMDLPMQRPNSLSVAGWQELFTACGDQADTVHSGLRTLIADSLDEVRHRWPVDLPCGLIHADLFPDNVFFAAGTTEVSGLIDFYFACTDILAYDLAIVLNAWCFEADGSFNATRARALLAGYRSLRPLSTAELDALPLLARGAALRFLLTRLYDWINTPPDALVKRKDPMDYVRRLRFHRQIHIPAEYGL